MAVPGAAPCLQLPPGHLAPPTAGIARPPPRLRLTSCRRRLSLCVLSLCAPTGTPSITSSGGRDIPAPQHFLLPSSVRLLQPPLFAAAFQKKDFLTMPRRALFFHIQFSATQMRSHFRFFRCSRPRPPACTHIHTHTHAISLSFTRPHTHTSSKKKTVHFCCQATCRPPGLLQNNVPFTVGGPAPTGARASPPPLHPPLFSTLHHHSPLVICLLFTHTHTAHHPPKKKKALPPCFPVHLHTPCVCQHPCQTRKAIGLLWFARGRQLLWHLLTGGGLLPQPAATLPTTPKAFPLAGMGLAPMAATASALVCPCFCPAPHHILFLSPVQQPLQAGHVHHHIPFLSLSSLP